MGVFIDNPVVNITLILLITIGGLGFIVWSDVANLVVSKIRRIPLFKKKQTGVAYAMHLSVYTKLVLIITGILLFGGGAVFALAEWHNPATIGQLSVGDKLLASLFLKYHL